jgi:nicotinamide phosphoribosyltransferase
MTQRFQLKALHDLDSYKLSHPPVFPAGTSYLYANFTPRSDKLSGIPEQFNDHKLVWLGIQGTLKEFHLMWKESFFDRPKTEVLTEFAERTLPFTGEPMDLAHIAALHDLGYLPLSIKALPEGSKVPMQVPVFTIANTHPNFAWLVNNVETSLSADSWKVTTIATIAHAYRRLLTHYAGETGSPKEFVDWQGHSFGNRGMSGNMDAAKNLAGHSLSFLGSDSVSTVDWLEYAYGAKGIFIAGSVPATEHSVTTLNIANTEINLAREGVSGNLKKQAENLFIKKTITETYPTGIVSLVADSYDFFQVISETAADLKEEILARKPNAQGLAKVVFRPDSGDPVDILCGLDIPDLTKDGGSLKEACKIFLERIVRNEADSTPHGECGNSEVSGIFYYEGKAYLLQGYIEWNRHDKQYYYEDGYRTVSCVETVVTPEQKGAVECLWDIFNGTVTEKGFKVLHERVGLIYGDSITLDRADRIMKRLMKKGFASCNVVLGIGSFTYNYLTRDNFGFAMKATYGVVNGAWVEIYKDPATDTNKTKKSAKGLLRVEEENGTFVLYDKQAPEQEEQGALGLVYEDGEFYNVESFDTIRGRLVAYST